MDEENELGILEFIHALVETLDKYFENVSLFVCLGRENTRGACPADREPTRLTDTHPLLFPQVCELDIMFNLEKAHFILDEM